MKSKQKKILIILSISGILIIGGITIPLVYFFAPISRKTQELGQIDTEGNAISLDIEGDIAYVIDTTFPSPIGMIMIDVSDPTNPQKLGSYYDVGLPWAVDVDKDIAYIANFDRGLEIVNVSDPSTPIRLYHYESNLPFSDVQLVGDILYLADWYNGMRILNVSNPLNPTLLSLFTLSGVCVFAEIVGTRAYLMDHYNDYTGLVVVDISDPFHPLYLGEYAPSGVDFWDPIVKDDIMYVGDHSGGTKCFHILDVSNPSQIQELGLYTKGSMTSFAIEESILFSANYEQGLEIYDISDPINPKKVGRFDDGGAAYDVKVVGNIAYVADREDGLEIIKILI